MPQLSLSEKLYLLAGWALCAWAVSGLTGLNVEYKLLQLLLAVIVFGAGLWLMNHEGAK